MIKFGSWLLFTSAVAVLGSFGIRTIISRQVGAEGLGLYFLAISLALIPNEVATEVVGIVAFPLFARLKTNLEAAARAFRTILAGTMALLFPVCALIIVLAPILVQDILGEKWKETIPLIQL